MAMQNCLEIAGLTKEFCLHQQGGVRIPVLRNFNLSVAPGEALAVVGPSGQGKSSLLKLIYGTYLATAGSIRVRHRSEWIDVAQAAPRTVVELRMHSIGYVTQFLRVIPRVPVLDIVMEPMIERGQARESAKERASDLLSRLNVPERLWHLSPTTFSGGEQQRVNIARVFAAHNPILLLDEPTASLDADNRDRVLSLVEEARNEGSAIVAVFHDVAERERICRRFVAVGQGY
ncbi:MAG: phosphonate C-P lyase system protein PhnL [Aestuariivirga sp.]